MLMVILFKFNTNSFKIHFIFYQYNITEYLERNHLINQLPTDVRLYTDY